MRVESAACNASFSKNAAGLNPGPVNQGALQTMLKSAPDIFCFVDSNLDSHVHKAYVQEQLLLLRADEPMLSILSRSSMFPQHPVQALS